MSFPRPETLRFGLRCAVLAAIFAGGQSLGQTVAPPEKEVSPAKEELAPAPEKVDVQPVALDDEIRTRLERVLVATGWFENSKVEVDEGVVVLRGKTKSEDLKKWAGDLARNTQDVVAVANRIEVMQPSVWDFAPAWGGVEKLWRDFIQLIPFLVFGLLILGVSWLLAMLATRQARSFLTDRVEAKLLRNVIARGIGVLVMLVGTYVVLRVAGLTQLALTVLGGTGLIGLAVGIAFRDITENFLASVFLSKQQPFATGDLIEVNGVMGFVQQLNIRTTVLAALDGTMVQIPNATVYKSNIRNLTINENRRDDFLIGIGYDDSIAAAQEVARQVLADHPTVLADPEPLVLVENLGKSTVNLRIYFWFNTHDHSIFKIRSSVIRLVRTAFAEHGISIPDEAREVVFPRGVPVVITEKQPEAQVGVATSRPTEKKRIDKDHGAVATQAEAGLSSEASEIEKQARKMQPLNEDENLLTDSAGDRSNASPSAGPPGK